MRGKRLVNADYDVKLDGKMSNVGKASVSGTVQYIIASKFSQSSNFLVLMPVGPSYRRNVSLQYLSALGFHRALGTFSTMRELNLFQPYFTRLSS